MSSTLSSEPSALASALSYTQPTVPLTACVVSVVIPVYNEAATLETVVRRVRAVPGLTTEIICVDDGSRDASRDILARLHAAGLVDRVIYQDRNRGKGAAVRAGLQAATGHIVVVQDADLEYDPAEIPALVQPILAGKADAVLGSRFLGGPHRVLYFWHYLANKFLTTLSNICSNLNVSDMETCYKALRRDLVPHLPLVSDRFGFEPELTARLAQAGARIYEIQISYAGRTYEEGKKITWKDGVAALRHIVAANFCAPRAHRVTLPPFHEVVAARRAGGTSTAAVPAAPASSTG